MNIWFPRIEARFLPGMLGISFLGAIAAGTYGMSHDHITSSISEEYAKTSTS